MNLIATANPRTDTDTCSVPETSVALSTIMVYHRPLLISLMMLLIIILRIDFYQLIYNY